MRCMVWTRDWSSAPIQPRRVDRTSSWRRDSLIGTGSRAMTPQSNSLRIPQYGQGNSTVTWVAATCRRSPLDSSKHNTRTRLQQQEHRDSPVTVALVREDSSMGHAPPVGCHIRSVAETAARSRGKADLRASLTLLRPAEHRRSAAGGAQHDASAREPGSPNGEPHRASYLRRPSAATPCCAAPS
jgi:hypothetical protein